MTIGSGIAIAAMWGSLCWIYKQDEWLSTSGVVWTVLIALVVTGIAVSA